MLSNMLTPNSTEISSLESPVQSCCLGRQLTRFRKKATKTEKEKRTTEATGNLILTVLSVVSRPRLALKDRQNGKTKQR